MNPQKRALRAQFEALYAQIPEGQVPCGLIIVSCTIPDETNTNEHGLVPVDLTVKSATKFPTGHTGNELIGRAVVLYAHDVWNADAAHESTDVDAKVH
jgi:hypothetical protein